MKEKITLISLSRESVTVKRQKIIELDGVSYPVGKPSRKVYENSLSGRMEVNLEIDEMYKNAIFAVWGNEPTIDDVIEDNNP